MHGKAGWLAGSVQIPVFMHGTTPAALSRYQAWTQQHRQPVTETAALSSARMPLNADIHVTVRLWHLALFLVCLVAILHLQSASQPQEYAVRRKRGERRRNGHRPHHFGATSLELRDQPPQLSSHGRDEDQRLIQPYPQAAAQDPPEPTGTNFLAAQDALLSPPPPPRPVPAPAARSILEASTDSLIAELHSRAYDWEVLEGARVGMSSLKAQELLHFLRRNASQFRQYLEGSSLGLGIHTTPQLLRAVSRRPDLADALRATGLGAGSDFKCDFDESPRDAGCQVRCTLTLTLNLTLNLTLTLSRTLSRTLTRRRLPGALHAAQVRARGAEVPGAGPLHLTRREPRPHVGHTQVAAGIHAGSAADV